MDYVLDTRYKGKKVVDEVPVVWSIPTYFFEDFPRLPPVRKVEFQVDLVLGAAPIAKSHNRLSPPDPGITKGLF